jgi:hypothetical protein
MNHELKSYLKLHFIVLIWGFSAILGLLITLSAPQVVYSAAVKEAETQYW